MATWPASLPQAPMVSGLSVKDQDSVLRTPMDAGHPTTRNRFTAISQDVNVSVQLTGSQYATLQTFYRTTLHNGAFSFDWTHPATDQTVSYKFRSPPEYALVTPDPDPLKRLWTVNFQLEVQP